MVLSDSDVRALPKVELHCHIEGTMRSAVGLDVTPGWCDWPARGARRCSAGRCSRI